MKWDVLVPHDRIKVTAENGRLTLEGEVDRQFQKSAAERAVLHLTGVKGVTNQITIKPKVAPTEVKEKIEAAFKRNAIFDAHQINVQAEGGTVTLSGSVGSWAEREEAEELPGQRRACRKLRTTSRSRTKPVWHSPDRWTRSVLIALEGFGRAAGRAGAPL